MRDEEVFAAPSMLRASPRILGYYRLLLGVSQKQFYTSKRGLGIFKSMEDRGTIGRRAEPQLDELCTALNEALSGMLHALPSTSLRASIDQLPLLTLGGQAGGSWNTKIGETATREVFEALKSIAQQTNRLVAQTETSITVVNNSDREVTLALAADPDVVIREQFPASSVYKTAIEIKGGTDYANIHNRAGEAEKSHQKARQRGAGDFWTIIDLAHADRDKLSQESPTTRQWIDIGEVRRRSGDTWDLLVNLTRSAMGI